MSFFRMLAILLLVAILALGAACWMIGNEMVGRRFSTPFTQPVPPAELVSLTAADGVRIAATYWPGQRPDAPGVLLLHGLGASRQQLAANAAWLAQQGFATLAIDFRGHGQSGDALHSFGPAESLDAHAAFAWLKARQQGAPIGLIGVSLGGAAALLGENGPVPAQAFVLQAVFPDFRQAIRNRYALLLPAPAPLLMEPLLSYQAPIRFGVWPEQMRPVDAVRLIRAPLLVVGGGEDRNTPPDETRAMFDAAPGPKRLLLLDGLDHGETSDVQSEAYRGVVLRFFKESLGAP